MNDNYGSVEHFYKTQYSQMIGERSTGILSFLWKYPHKLLEKNNKNNKELQIIEVGAGEGEHFRFVRPGFTKYVLTDIDDRRLTEFSQRSARSDIAVHLSDAGNLDYPSDVFDRLVATCLLMHLKNPEDALIEWRRVVKAGGKIDIYIPCEPGLALRIFRKLITAPKAKKQGFQGYELYIARDHINSAQGILEFLKYVFRNDEIKFHYRPFYFKSWYLNLFLTVEIRVQK